MPVLPNNAISWRYAALALVSLGVVGFAVVGAKTVTLGKQPDGSYVVSTGQHIVGGAISFRGRPSDLALHPNGKVCAVLSQGKVFLATAEGVVENSAAPLSNSPGFRGIAWSPDGSRLFVTTGEKGGNAIADGSIQSYVLEGNKLKVDVEIPLNASGEPDNPAPGGMAITKDGRRLYVAAANLNSVVEVDLQTNKRVRRIPVGMVPFAAKLSEDEQTLIVSNWGGREPKKDDLHSQTGNSQIVVDERGAPASGTVSLIDLKSNERKDIEVGIHPSDMVVSGDKLYVANTMSDSISELDLRSKSVLRTIPIRWGKMRVIGSMPCALAIKGQTLYACSGGDNALCEIDLKSGKVLGFRPAGYFPIALAVSDNKAFVLNSKGNGSVSNTAYGRIGNAHNFEGTISVIDLSKNLGDQSKIVADNNGWDRKLPRPNLPVYNGEIKHVLYIIKENRTYDEIYGDMPEGNGDPKLCSIGEKIMPNHRALAREFTLFDNGYVSGTNSADGHAWSTQALANDYLEHFYVGYSRTYPDDGDCAMSISTGGCIWDAAAKKKKSIRVYGEFCDDAMAEYLPYRPKDWFEAWEDRKKGTNKFTYVPHTHVNGLKPYVNPRVHYWPLIQSDQSRADEFIKEYTSYSQQNKVPNLMVLSLCCDHSEGTDPNYPSPRAMMADNDLALGRVVEAISKSKEWKNTCIFVIEDDAQSGPDHVDGHRTSYLVISPYNRRHTVDHNLYTTTNMLRSIEMMLGLDPMNRFDALSKPIDSCFADKPDLTAFKAKPNNIPLDEPNPGRKTAMSSQDKYWAEKTRSLNWSHIDGPDSYWLNRIIWASLHKDGTPYPARPNERPGGDD